MDIYSDTNKFEIIGISWGWNNKYKHVYSPNVTLKKGYFAYNKNSMPTRGRNRLHNKWLCHFSSIIAIGERSKLPWRDEKVGNLQKIFYNKGKLWVSKITKTIKKGVNSEKEKLTKSNAFPNNLLARATFSYNLSFLVSSELRGKWFTLCLYC